MLIWVEAYLFLPVHPQFPWEDVSLTEFLAEISEFSMKGQRRFLEILPGLHVFIGDFFYGEDRNHTCVD